MSPKVKFTFIWWITSDLFHSTSRILPRTICSPHFHQDTRSYSKRFILFQQPFNPRFLLASWNNSVMLCTLFNQCLLQQWQDACIDHTGPETLFSFTSRVPADLLKKKGFSLSLDFMDFTYPSLYLFKSVHEYSVHQDNQHIFYVLAGLGEILVASHQSWANRWDRLGCLGCRVGWSATFSCHFFKITNLWVKGSFRWLHLAECISVM